MKTSTVISKVKEGYRVQVFINGKFFAAKVLTKKEIEGYGIRLAVNKTPYKVGQQLRLLINDRTCRYIEGTVTEGNPVDGLFFRIDNVNWKEGSSIMDRFVSYYCGRRMVDSEGKDETELDAILRNAKSVEVLA